MSLSNDWDTILDRLRQVLSKRWPDVFKEMEAMVEQLRRYHGLPTPWVSHGTLCYPVQGCPGGYVSVGSVSEGQYTITIERARSLEIVQERWASLATVVEEVERALCEAPALLSGNHLPSSGYPDETK